MTARPLSFFSALGVLLALGALGLVTLWDMLDGPGTPREERVAATPVWPSAPGEIPRYLAEARFHATERYAFKAHFIAADSAIKFGLFRHSTAPNVMVGQRGFLFLGIDAPISLVQGQGRLSGAESQIWATHFRVLRERTTAVGLPFALIIAPNKHAIYDEALPDWVRMADPETTRTHQIIRLAQTHLDPGTLDATHILRGVRRDRPEARLYHATDTHWTQLGAALVLHAALAQLGFPAPLPETVVERAPRSGDLARMIGRQAVLAEDAPVLAASGGWSCRDETGTRVRIETVDPLLPPRLTCTNRRGADKTLVVVHDSFGAAAIPYLASRFRRVEFIWTDAADPGLARALGADAMLQILVERKLADTHPAAFLAGKPDG